MKYATSAGPNTHSGLSQTDRTHSQDNLRAFQQTHSSSVSRVQSAAMALDGTRLFNLLEECRFHYSPKARERARVTLHRWLDGVAVFPDTSTADLFALLARQMTPEEKLALIRDLWHQWVADLPRDSIRVTVVRGSDLIAIARRVAGSMRYVPTALPAEITAVLGWLSDADAQTLGAIALGAERCLMAQRLAAVLVHLAALARLRTLSSPLVAVRVQASLEAPTLSVTLRFQPCFWRQAVLPQGDASGQGLLLRLQELALLSTPSVEPSELDQDDLTPAERKRLTGLAAAVGLQSESLLQELQAQTLAARADIEATAAIAERMRVGRLLGRVISEHASSGCTSRIEVSHALCPLARLAALRQ